MVGTRGCSSALAEDGIGDGEIEGGIDVDDIAFVCGDGAAIGAEEGVRAGGEVGDVLEKGCASEGEDAAIWDVGGGEELAAVGVVKEGVTFPGREAGLVIDADGPPGVVFADVREGLDGVAVGGGECGDRAIEEIDGTDGDIGVEDDDGAGPRLMKLRFVGGKGVPRGIVDGGGV